MKFTNIRGFGTIDEYVKAKLNEYSKEDKSFESLFKYMFSEEDNVMAETSDGYRIKKTTYGEFKKRILEITPTVSKAIRNVPQGEMVGLYMSNSTEWIEIFWAILASGYSPLLMNTRLSDSVLEGILKDYSVKCVISDGKIFSVPTKTAEEVTVASDKPYERVPFGKEVIFMSSGTTDNVKLCAYTSENFYYQICDSVNIIEECPKIKEHYEGELKHLVLLPFCHVFGFIAVYMWFGFFSRTFVFPKDLNPDTIQRTVKKHKVTHIFAVPMVWEAVCKAAISKVKERGDKTYKRFTKASSFVNNHGRLGDTVARRMLTEVREGLFGDSITCMITGGGHIRPETLRFFNGIGYHLLNGYGMTEIGITSLEKSSKRKDVNSGAVGTPCQYTEYSLEENGILLVKGKTRAARIMQNGTSLTTNSDEWFNTGDLARVENGKYFIEGRTDDLIVLEDGENLNPQLAENQIRVVGIDRLCIFKSSANSVTLLASVPGVFQESALKSIYDELSSSLVRIKLDGVVRKILFTHEGLTLPGEFKVSRKKIAARVSSGAIKIFDPRKIDEHVAELSEGIEAEIASCFAEALGKDISSIGRDDNFFRDLEGTSIDYFALLSIIKNRLGINIISNETEKLSTVGEFADYIKQSFNH